MLYRSNKPKPHSSVSKYKQRNGQLKIILFLSLNSTPNKRMLLPSTHYRSTGCGSVATAYRLPSTSFKATSTAVARYGSSSSFLVASLLAAPARNSVPYLSIVAPYSSVTRGSYHRILLLPVKTLWGNYVPFEVLFAQLALIAAGNEKPVSTGPEVSAFKTDGQPIVNAIKRLNPFYRGSQTSEGTPDANAPELEAQKKDLTGLVKDLTKDANDLRRDSLVVKAENEKLKGAVNELEDELRKLGDQLKACQADKEAAEKEARKKLEDELGKKGEDAKELQNELENERRLSQELDDDRKQAEGKAEDLEKQLEEERRKSSLAKEAADKYKEAADKYKKELESKGDPDKPLSVDPELQKASDKLQKDPDKFQKDSDKLQKDADKLQKELEDERRNSDAARDSIRKLEKQLQDATKKDADDAVEEKSSLKRALKMEQCLRNELNSLENENDCLRKEIERLRMVECELADCELKVQDLLCEVESYKCCLERQEYDNQKMTCLIKEQQELIFNLQDVVTSSKSNENLQSESWASCNESIIEYQCRIEDLNNTVTKQKCLITSQGECLKRQHSYITQLEQIRCKLHSQVEVYKTEIQESKTEVDILCKKRKHLQQELDFLTNKLEHYLGKIQELEKSQILNSKSCGQTMPARSDRGSVSGYSNSSRDNYGGSSSKYCSSLQPEQESSARLTGNRPASCRNRSCQPGQTSNKPYGYR